MPHYYIISFAFHVPEGAELSLDSWASEKLFSEEVEEVVFWMMFYEIWEKILGDVRN